MFLGACTPSAEVTSGSASDNKNVNAEAPFVWGNKTFPKTVRISSDFSDQEVTAITAMSTAWKTSVNDQKTFFAYGARSNNVHNIEEPDGVMGIYKTTAWPADVDDSALAITQLFGRRYNVGDPDEYVSIEHADILVNYKPGPWAFDFDIDDNGVDEGFDLRTVVLHEMGHFLGLQHIPTYSDRPESEDNLTRDQYKATSVMYPSISSVEEKRVPKTKDVNELINKYSISGASGGAAIAAANDRYKPKNEDPGKNVKIVIELRADGECVHKENGAILKRHSVKIQK